MDPELKAEWVAALRSGNYRQGNHQLYRIDDQSFCCLGVLCEVAKLERRGDTYYHTTSQSDQFLPESFREKAKISNIAMRKLTRLNDKERMTFPQIADYIEENL